MLWSHSLCPVIEKSGISVLCICYYLTVPGKIIKLVQMLQRSLPTIANTQGQCHDIEVVDWKISAPIEIQFTRNIVVDSLVIHHTSDQETFRIEKKFVDVVS